MRNAIIPAFVIVLFAVIVTGTRGNGSNGPQRSPAAESRAETTVREIVGAKGVYCTLIADSPRRSGSGDRMAAAGRFRCDRPGAEALGLLVTLQRQSADGTWVNVVNAQFTAAGADTTRDRDEEQRTRTVTAACVDGTYRTVVDGATASRDSDGKVVRKEYHSTTRGTQNPCSRRR